MLILDPAGLRKWKGVEDLRPCGLRANMMDDDDEERHGSKNGVSFVNQSIKDYNCYNVWIKTDSQFSSLLLVSN